MVSTKPDNVNSAISLSWRNPLPRKWTETAFAWFISLVLVSILFMLNENIGLNLADEGFLWYGAAQTVQGNIPLRDFQSYDPGRYYWVAAWMLLFGEQDIVINRLAVALFQVLGLGLGLLAARRVVRWWLLPIVGVVLVAWMCPRHKLFEPSLAMAAVYFAVRLIEEPTLRQYFVSGVVVGLAAFFGRNHGLYSFSAFFLLILLLQFKLRHGQWLKQVSLWLIGVAAGYMPMWLMLAFIPGIFDHFIHLIRFLLKERTTNLPLPVPWPWLVNYGQLDLLTGLSSFSIGFFFLLLPLFYLLATVSILQTKREDITRRSLFIASTCVGIFYMHYAFSRADLGHLAQGIHPLLLALFGLPVAFGFEHRKVLVTGGILSLLFLSTFGVIVNASPYIQKSRSEAQFRLHEVSGRQLWLNQGQAAYLEAVNNLVNRYAKDGESLLIAPHSPGLYAVLKRQSPLWETYLIFPETRKRQHEMIKDLEAHRVNSVILSDVALDGRDELRFRHTHPLVWQYITDKFAPVDAPGFPANEQFLRRKITLN